MSGFRRAYSITGVVLLALFALQLFLIAAAAMSVWGAVPQSGEPTGAEILAGFKLGDTFAMIHGLNGTFVIPLVILVMIGLAFGARHSSRVKWLTAGLFGLMVIQFFLPWVSGMESNAGSLISGLHGLNALLLIGLTVYLTRENWAYGAERLGQPSVATAP